MKTALSVAVAILIFEYVVSYAQAQNNQQNEQWRAYFSNGPTNCGFAAFEQYLQAIRGKTALCDRDHQYVQPSSAQLSETSRRRRSLPNQ